MPYIGCSGCIQPEQSSLFVFSGGASLSSLNCGFSYEDVARLGTSAQPPSACQDAGLALLVLASVLVMFRFVCYYLLLYFVFFYRRDVEDN